ncbi:MAG TPA: hypothetical protein VGM83_15265 [Devosiaceae bacterium]|jgi:hypothetical protein
MTSNFWEFLWLIVSSFFLLAYLVLMFQIIVDLFRDEKLGGFAKAIWVICLFVLPMLTALFYLIVRGGSMAERQSARARQEKSEADAYIRNVAGKSPATQIAEAKALLDAGTISESEFGMLKAKALA